MAAFEHKLRVRFQHTDPAGIVWIPLEEFIGKRQQTLPIGEDEHLATAATAHVSVDPSTGRSTGIAPPLRELLEKTAA